jgi:hypothetical protein
MLPISLTLSIMLGLAKSGYKSNMKCKSLINLLYLWLHTENQIYKSGKFYYFFSHFWQTKASKITSFKLFISLLFMSLLAKFCV